MEFVTNSHGPRLGSLGPASGWLSDKSLSREGLPAGLAPPVSHHLHLGGMVPQVMGSKPQFPDQQFARRSPQRMGRANEFDVNPAHVSMHPPADSYRRMRAPLNLQQPQPQPQYSALSSRSSASLACATVAPDSYRTMLTVGDGDVSYRTPSASERGTPLSTPGREPTWSQGDGLMAAKIARQSRPMHKITHQPQPTWPWPAAHHGRGVTPFQ